MILRVCVVIPTSNNSRTISTVVKDVVKTTSFPVLIIDDGSETAVENVLYSFEVRQALEEGRVRVVRFDQPRGKGTSLKFAIEDLISRGFTHMMTMDGDGKHLGKEISKLVQVAKEYPWDLVISGRSSQSGFRLYPLFAIQTMKFWSRGDDFEVEALLRFMLRGNQPRKIDVESLESSVVEPIKWWHQIRSDMRSAMLKKLLQTISLLKSQTSPAQLAIAVGVGAFVGCTPFFGFHALIVAGLAVILPLNFVAMLLGTHISVLPLAPIVVLASMVIGKSIPGLNEIDGPMAHFYQWLAGSLILGTVAGFVLGVLTYAACLYYRRESKGGINRRVMYYARRVRTGFYKFAVANLGLRFGYFCVYPATGFTWALSHRTRKALNEYYSILMPGLKWGQRQRLLFKHLLSAGKLRMDRLYFSLGKGRKFQVNCEGLSPVTDALNQGNRLILLSAHIGSWDLTADLLGLDECMAMMADRPSGERIELIPFLGKLAPFDVSAFVLASTSRIPMAFSFGIKNSEGGYDFVAGTPREYVLDPKRVHQLQLLEWIGQFVREVEEVVRSHPNQWTNLFPYWSGRAATNTHNYLLEDLKPPIAKTLERTIELNR